MYQPGGGEGTEADLTQPPQSQAHPLGFFTNGQDAASAVASVASVIGQSYGLMGESSLEDPAQAEIFRVDKQNIYS